MLGLSPLAVAATLAEVAAERKTLSLTPASPEALKVLDQVNDFILSFDQVPIATEHLLGGGMYARTVRLRPGTVMMGSLIKRETVLIVHGHALMLSGEEFVEIDGYNVFQGCAGRKQLFRALGAVEMTMVAATGAASVPEAEDEVFAEADQLMSRKDGNPNTVTIAGE